MFKKLKIGKITVPMLANGATPIRYKNIFHKDVITEFEGAKNDSAKVTNSMPELAFVMAMQAQAKEGKVDLNLIDQEMYIEWLEQFDPMDLPFASDAILDVYMGNNATSSEAKKKSEEQSES